MIVWFGFAILAIAIVGAIVVIQQRKSLPGKRTAALPTLKRNIFTLQIGDIVQYEGRDWVVEGRLTFDDSGYTWMEYMLQDGDDLRWLSVEEDDRVEVCWMKTVTDLEISRTPPQTISHNGITYHRTNQGTAKMTRVGTTLNKQSQHCRYYDYDAPNNQVLAVETWNDDHEVSVGQRINPRALMLLPGDGKRVYDDV